MVAASAGENKNNNFIGIVPCLINVSSGIKEISFSRLLGKFRIFSFEKRGALRSETTQSYFVYHQTVGRY